MVDIYPIPSLLNPARSNVPFIGTDKDLALLFEGYLFITHNPTVNASMVPSSTAPLSDELRERMSEDHGTEVLVYHNDVLIYKHHSQQSLSLLINPSKNSLIGQLKVKARILEIQGAKYQYAR